MLKYSGQANLGVNLPHSEAKLPFSLGRYHVFNTIVFFNVRGLLLIRSV